jgi:anti-anti-sigma factor
VLTGGDDATANPLTVSVDTTGGHSPILYLAGDLDFQTAELLTEHLDWILAEQPTRLVLDLRALTFIDSTGLAAIVNVWRCAAGAGAGVQLRHAPPFLISVLDITGVGELLQRPLPAVDDGSATTA